MHRFEQSTSEQVILHCVLERGHNTWGRKEKKQAFVWWISRAVSSLQHRSVRMRSSAAGGGSSRRRWMRSCQGPLPAAGSSPGPGQGALTAVRRRRKEENQADQNPRGLQMALFIPRQVKSSVTHSSNNRHEEGKSCPAVVGEELSRNSLWVKCSSHKNADEFTFAEFLRQHLVSLFPCQLMRNLSTYVAYCGFSLLAPLAVGSMLSTGKGEAREIVTRNKAQGFCIPTSSDGLYCLCVLEQIRPFQLELGYGGWNLTCSELVLTWLLTSQGSCCSLPIFSLTRWWVGLSHILQWVKSSKSVHKDSSSAQLLWNPHALALPEVELENGDMAVQHQPPLGASWD